MILAYNIIHYSNIVDHQETTLLNGVFSVQKFLTSLALTSTIIYSQNLYAAETIAYAPAADWIKQTDIVELLEEKKDSNAYSVLWDEQIKIEDGVKEEYSDLVLRASSADFLSQMGTSFKATWQKDRANITIHAFEIYRDGKIINLLDDEDDIFEIIRRERNLERQQLNGQLTATTQLRDLQLGDVVRFAYTIKTSNPSLKERGEFSRSFSQTERSVDKTYRRIIWPKNKTLNWKTHSDDINPHITSYGNYNEMVIDTIIPKEKDKPKNAPIRYRMAPFFEASNFKSWKEVSAVASSQYKSKGLIKQSPELLAAVQSIRTNSNDPMKQAELAIRLVQEKIRYLYNGLGYGNYEPQSPSETWQLKYGDCKAKTLLLLSILHELDIDAVPILVNLNLKDAIGKRIPSMMAFNHIMVKANIDGQTLWMDGTGQGDRLRDIMVAPDYRYALPVVPSGADLEEITITRNSIADQDTVLRYDLSAGRALPALLDVELTLRDQQAFELENTRNQFSNDRFQEKLRNIAASYVLGNTIYNAKFSFNNQTREGIIRAKGISWLDWKKKAGKFKHEIWSALTNSKISKDRTSEEWKDIPVLVSNTNYFREKTQYILPQYKNPFTLSGNAQISVTIEGRTTDRETLLRDNILSFSEATYPVQWEVKPSQLTIDRQTLNYQNRKAVSIVLPDDAPEEWREFDAAKTNGAAEKIITGLNTYVDNAKADDNGPLNDRAYFYWQLGDYEKASQDLEASIAIEPTAANYNWLATMLVGTNEKTALSALEKSLDLEPTNYDSIFDMVKIYTKQNNIEKAMAIVAKAQKQGLSDIDAAELNAEIFRSQGKYDKANALISELLEDDPDNAFLLSERCLTNALANKDLPAAKDDCTLAIEIANKPAYILEKRAIVHWKMGNHDMAIADLDRAIHYSKNRSGSHYLKAVIYKDMGKTELAENAMRMALFQYKFADDYYKSHGITY